jgi:hypothetical protein
METPGRPFRVGDRVEWVGPIKGPIHEWPQPGERGWILDLTPFDPVIAWDEAGTTGGWDVASDPDVALVDDRNEPDPAKRIPYDPYEPGSEWGGLD